MRFPFRLLFLATLAAATACDSTRETTTGQPKASVSAATPVPRPEPTGFQQKLASGPYAYTVSSSGQQNLRLLTLRAEQAGRELTTAQDTLAGEVRAAVLAKLTSGPGDELLVFTESPGSGSYGDVRGYWFGGQDWERMEPLPKLTGAAARGYQGQDRFEVRGNTLERSFPVYLPTDANCCPSGGLRTISYRMADGSLIFRQAGIVNEPKAAR